MDWTVIVIAVLAFLAFLMWCSNRLELKRVELEIEKARPRQTIFGEIERTPSPADP